MGDILQSFPVAFYLREKSPYGQIDWIVEKAFAPLVSMHPAIDRVITFERKFGIPLRSKGCFYDVVFDLQGNCKSGFLTWRARSRAKVGFAWKDLPEKPSGLTTNVKFPLPKNKNIREDYLSLVQNYFQDFSKVRETHFLFPLSEQEQKEIETIEKGVLVCPGAHWPSKRLSLKNWIAILEKIKEPIYFVWGSKEELLFVKKMAQYGIILPKLTLAQLQNVIAKSNRVIAMDSLPLHLCATTRTPAFAFFGPSSLQKFLPEGSDGVQGSCPFHVSFERRCPHLRSCQSLACMDHYDQSRIFDH